LYFMFTCWNLKTNLLQLVFFFLLIISSFIYRKMGTLCGAEQFIQ
jgi:hypothetical protein